MSFPSALDSGKYTKVRGDHYYADEYILLGSNTVIFAARVNGAPTGNTYAQVTFDTVTTGAYTAVEQYMTVYISHTNDIKAAFYRGYARKVPTSSVLYFGENSEPIADNDYIFVVRDWALHQKLVRVDGAAYYKDYDLTYGAPKPQFKDLQSAYAGVCDATTGLFTLVLNPTAFATAPGATISSYLCAIPGSGVTVTAGSLSTNSVTLTFAAAATEYWLSYKATDSNGTFILMHFPVFAIPSDLSTTIYLGFEGAAINATLDDGFNATIPAFEGIEDVLDQTLCVTLDIEYYNGVKGSLFTSIKHVGRLRRNTDSNAGDEQASRTLAASFEVEGMAAQLTRTYVDKIRMVYTASPTIWDELTSLTPWRATCHILQHHTTFSEINSLSFDDVSSTYLYPSFVTKGESVLASIKDTMDSINAQIEWASSGEARIIRDLRYGTTAERDAATVVANVESQDWIEISLDHSHVDEYGLVDGAAGTFSTANEQEQLIFAKWPGITRGEGFNNDTFARQVMEANLTKDGARAAFRRRIGYRAAILNTRDRLTVTFPDQWNWLTPSVGMWYTFTVVILEDDLRHEFDTNTRWLCESVTLQHDNATGGKTVSAVFVRETESSDGQDYEPPVSGGTSPTTPDIPPFSPYGYLGDPGSLYPPDLLSPYAPIYSGPTSPLTPITASVDGSVLLAVTSGTTSRLWITREGLLARPHWIDITPPLLSGEAIQDAMWGGMGLADIYVVAHDGTDSHVYYCENGLLTVPVWVQSEDLSGTYTAIRQGQADGEIIIEGVTSSASACIDDWVVTLGTEVSRTGNTITANSTFAGGSHRVHIATTASTIGGGAANPPASGYSRQVGFSPVVPTTIGWMPQGATYPGGFVTGLLGSACVWYVEFLQTVSFTTTITLSDAGGCGDCGTIAAVTAYSTDHGATFATAVPVGTPATISGFDTQKNGTVVLASVDGQMRKNTLSGASYADYSTPLEQGAVFIPYYQLGSITTANTGSTPHYVLNSSAVVAGESLWKITAAGATITNITPAVSSDKGLALSPNSLTMPRRSGQIIIGVFGFGTDRKIARTLNSGSSWTYSSALNAAADCVVTRINDRQNRQLWFANGANVGYIKNYQTSLTVSNKPLPTTDTVTIVRVYG